MSAQTTARTLTTDQAFRLQAYAEANGRYWKSALRDDWEKCLGELIDVRNQFGPTWLVRISMRDLRRAQP